MVKIGKTTFFLAQQKNIRTILLQNNAVKYGLKLQI
jgi:hypothetical protein